MKRYLTIRAERSLKCDAGDGDELLFVNSKGKPLTRGGVAKSLKEMAFVAYGNTQFAKRIRAHGLRKGGVTDMTLNGVQDSILRRMARHSLLKSALPIYQCLPPEAIARLVLEKAKRRDRNWKRFPWREYIKWAK